MSTLFGRAFVRRRVVLAAVVAAAVLASALVVVRLSRPPVTPPAHAEQRPKAIPVVNPIVAENRRAGTSAWHLRRFSGRALDGYAGATSVAPGDRLAVYASSNYPSFSAEIYRMGWYQGLGARLVQTLRALRAPVQPAPTVDPVTRMVEARWRPAFTIDVGADWTTGVYLVKLTAPDGKASYVPFTVRESGRRAPFVFQSSVTTWQAYNDWGGHSLYTGELANGDRAAKLRSTVASFDRPYNTGAGAGDFFYMEFSILRWLEEQGYDMAYATNIDMQEDPSLLTGRRGFLSMGHDEYYSTAMRANLQTALDSGVNLAFLGANAIYRHIRFESSPIGPDRREVNYRFANADPITPVDPKESTVQWRDPPVSRAEDQILGPMYECNPVHADAVVYDPLPSLFAGTGLKTGDRITGLIGREYDRMYHYPKPPRRTWVLFRSPVQCNHLSSVADTTLTLFPSGAYVFDASTQGFDCAFGDCTITPPDERVQRLVRNLLDAYLAGTDLAVATPRPYSIGAPHVVQTMRAQQQQPATDSNASPVRPASTPTAPRTP